MLRRACPLTARQHEILLLIARGLTQKQIALELGVAYTTVRTQLGTAYRRLDVTNAAQAVVVLMNNGWLEEDADFPLPSPGLRERLGLDRDSAWWQSSDTGDDPVSRLLEHMALVPAKPPRGYRVIPPPPSPPTESLAAAAAADQLARNVPRIRLKPERPQQEEKAA
mgnify:CR=1 FL=1